MKSTQKTYQSQTYKSNNHKAFSRTPLSINASRYTTFKANESQNLGRNKNFGLLNKPVFESLNMERKNYIYVDNPPDTNLIFFDSNLRKYRTLSVGSKNSSYNEKTYNPIRNKVNSSGIKYNQTNLSTFGKVTKNNSGNKYNQHLRCICGKDSMERSFNLDKMADQRGNRTYNSLNQRNNMTQYSRDNKYQVSSRNGAQLAKEKQDQRIHSYANKVEPRKDYTSKNVNMNKNMRVNTADRLNTQKNQGSRRNEQEKEKQNILNKMQREKEKEKNKYEFNIPRPTKEKAYQGDMINRKINNDTNTNAKTNINKPSTSLNNQANYTPIQINKSSNKDYNAKKEVGDLAPMDLEQFKKMQSPYKNEEIIKDENGEIVKRKEEKTIIILPGQTIEPKSIIETFEKPTIEVVQNEDGTSQSILRQTKIITNVENIPITNPKSSSKKGEGDLQLIKQIITHEYKTVSANKDETDKKEENKEKENEKEGLNINLENNMNKENEKNIDKINEMKENDTTGKKLRYMDLEEDENDQKENIMKENKKTEFETNKKPGNKLEAKEKEKYKNIDANLKSKNKNKAKNEQLNHNKKTDEEMDSKNKNINNIKSNLTEKQSMTKKEKEKSNDKSKELNLSKKKDKSLKDSSKKEINLDKKQGKDGEETNLRKSFRRNKKGEKEKKDDKQSDKDGNIKIVFELYEKCFKLGNKPGSEKDIAKIVEILIVLEEKKWKDILNKLLKAFPKSNDLNKKILDLIINKKVDKTNKDKNKLKGKGSGNKTSEEKDVQKENRSKSQIKASGLKNKLKLEEEDNIKGETDKKLKFLENGGKASLVSNSNFGVNSVNVANIGNLNFDGLFLDISKYQNKERDKNPFEGPSTFYKFYKLRQSKIKKKIIDMTNEAKNN